MCFPRQGTAKFLVQSAILNLCIVGNPETNEISNHGLDKEKL